LGEHPGGVGARIAQKVVFLVIIGLKTIQIRDFFMAMEAFNCHFVELLG